MVDKAKKIERVAGFKETFSSAQTVVVAKFSKLTIPETDELRKIARKNNTSVSVAKNTLAKVALEGSKHAEIASLFKTQTIFTYSADPVGAAKTLVDFAKVNEKLSIAGGSFDGKLLDEAGVKTLANMPSLDQSRARIASLLVANATQIARLVPAVPAGLARVLAAHAEKNK